VHNGSIVQIGLTESKSKPKKFFDQATPTPPKKGSKYTKKALVTQKLLFTASQGALQPVYKSLPVPTISSTSTQHSSFSAGNKEKDSTHKQQTYQAAPYPTPP
jgi:hypothetical protein